MKNIKLNFLKGPGALVVFVLILLALANVRNPAKATSVSTDFGCVSSQAWVFIGQPVSFQVVNPGIGAATWSVVGGNPNSGSGLTFTTSFATTGVKDINVSETYHSNTCRVTVMTTETPPPTPTPTPIPISADIKCNGSDSSCTIPFGSVVNVSWTSNGATNCSVSPTGWSGTTGVMPDYLTNQRTYNITCTNADNSSSDSVTVFVVSPTPTPTPTPIVASISVNPSSICIGQSAYLSWMTANASQAYINQLGAVNLHGNQYVSPSQTTTYTMTATNSNGGYGTDSATVFVSGPCYTPTPTPTFNNLTLTKNVINLSVADTSELNSVNAAPGDLVEFVMRVQNSGNNFTNSVRMSDFLPSQLQYVSGSTTVDGVFFGDNVTTSNIFLGTLSVSQTKVVRFRALVRDASVFNFGLTQLTNTARVAADNTGTVDDTAFVNVNRGGVLGIVTLQIQKTGRNISKGDTVDKTSVDSTQNDTIEFTLRVKNSSATTANNVIVTDLLPTGMTYVNNTTSLNGITIANGVTGAGINIGSLVSNQEAVVRFYATVNSGISGTLTNISEVRADNYSQIVSNSVVISFGVVLGALDVKTGASLTLYLSLLAGLFSTLGFYWYKVRIV